MARVAVSNPYSLLAGARRVLAYIRQPREKRLRQSRTKNADLSEESNLQKFAASKIRDSKVKDQPVARRGVDCSQFVHDRAHHSMAHHGQDGFTHRAF
jgi:hypothetical protein